ncbi:MAG: TetR family transcriptional regulator C-terminal domain-containing protein, partial [Jatrophihabitantaceae bacterium]
NKDDLTRAVLTFQTEAILNAQTPMATLGDLGAWRDSIVAAAGRQHDHGGCPLGSLSSELANTRPWAREQLAASFTLWAQSIDDGLTAMVDNGILRTNTDTRQFALALLAAMQGGLILAQAQHTTEALEASLDTVIQRIREHSTSAP